MSKYQLFCMVVQHHLPGIVVVERYNIFLFFPFCCFFFTYNIFEVPYHQRKIRDHVIMSIWRIMMNIWRWRLGWMARRMSPPTSAAKIIVIQVFITVTIITIIIITVTVTSSASSSTLFFFQEIWLDPHWHSFWRQLHWLEIFETLFSMAWNIWDIFTGSKSVKHLRQKCKLSKGGRPRSNIVRFGLLFAFLLCWVQSDATSNLFIFYTRSSWKHPNMVFCATKRCLHEVLYIVSVFLERYSIYKLKSLFSHRHDMFSVVGFTFYTHLYTN